MELKMALLRKTEEVDVLEQVTPFVKCRDFLCDVHSSTLAKKDFHIYGMSWKGSKDSVDWDAIRLVVRFPDKKAKDVWMHNVFVLLHSIEAANVLDLTFFDSLENGDVTLVGDKFWLGNALKFSLYTFLLRVMCYKLEPNKWIEQFLKMNTTDSAYLASINKETLNRVLTDLSLLDTKEWCGLLWGKNSVSAVHHNSGFISVFGNHSEINYDTVKKNLHYKQMKEKGLTMYV
jgi:hypothetical protein